MRRSSLHAVGLTAASVLLLSACTADDTVDAGATDAATEAATDQPDESDQEASEAAGEGEWLVALAADCEDYKAAATAATEPIFQAEGEPDPEVVRQLFADLAPTVADIRDAVADADVADAEAAARDEWQAALDAQVTSFEAAGADAELAMTTLEELSGPFTPEAGAAADAAGAWQCGSGTTFAQAELSEDARAAAPRVPVGAVEYAFEVDGELTAGDAVVEFSNRGGEEHEMILFRIADGTTYDEALAFLEENADSEEEPEFLEAFHGGFAGPGGRTEVAVTFEPGTWMMICFIPTADGTPHFLEGMHQQITIA